MLEQIGVFTLSFCCAIAAFYLTFSLCDKMGWWREAGLAAIIPSGILSLVAAVLAGGVTAWLLKGSGQ